MFITDFSHKLIFKYDTKDIWMHRVATNCCIACQGNKKCNSV